MAGSDHEVLRGRRLDQPSAQRIDLALAVLHLAFATRELLHLPVDRILPAADLVGEIDALEVVAERPDRLAPTGGVLSDQGTVTLSLPEAGRPLK